MTNSSSAVPMVCANLICGKGIRHEFANGEPMYYLCDGGGPYCQVCYKKIKELEALERKEGE